ncbi:DUF3043 domain-containing protein [Cellulomonas sp. PhB143]|uniref:DUF3043 domain-containing protein n=1 Tax=Cellulomonas sp. PhB143 TaxID=2485186 RepID=UPI000F9116D4|nr:DUF3043 domain-containing protein [Cellulomonas sp. PhB143]ROS73033.1 DUF3043 family protein [Cellulomonas sp. PhB143]
MFSRSKGSDAPSTDVTPVEADVDPVGISTGKGRATPKRKEAEAANRRPLVPGDRKAAAKDARSKSREARARQQQALQNGDERYLPERDKGPLKRYVRDYVDARWNLGEFFLVVAFVALGLMIVTSSMPQLSVVVTMVLYGMVLITIVDAVLMWRGLKRRLLAKFGDVPSGTMMYAVMRAFQIRRARLPKPNHKQHGSYPE